MADPVEARPDRYRVTVQQYRIFHAQGFLVVPALVPPGEVAELVAHTDDIVHGRLDLPGVGVAPLGDGHTHSAILDPERIGELERRYVRIHMLHRQLQIHERFLLHPRILDVLQALIGPDVMAMQSMLFLKPPGSDGQGYHQDSYYIPTLPDSLCGAWLAIDRADEANGCMRFTRGSQHEPIYPDAHNRHQHYPRGEPQGLLIVDGVSASDEARNGLTPVARRYPGQEVLAPADPGDVVFFGGHILHRSLANDTSDRFRRSFVGHYANARSYTEWGGGNAAHILARGATHLPYAQPRFGTPCAANRTVVNSTPLAAVVSDDGMIDTAPIPAERLMPPTHDA